MKKVYTFEEAITVSRNNVHIVDSWKYKKEDFEHILESLAFIHKNTCNVFKYRSIKSLKREWVVHNFLYNIGYQRERTKDADLDWPQDWKTRLA